MTTCQAPQPACVLTQRLFECWEHWPQQTACERSHGIARWTKRREAIGGYVYELRGWRRVLVLINEDVRPRLCLDTDPARVHT